MGAPLTEDGLRTKLGIPLDAPQVLLLAESTHWDPNWLLTSEEYFRLRVRHTLDKAITELLHDPRRVYSLESAFYPDLYWNRRPEQRPIFRELVNTGRLRFTGSGVTTPDTLIPDDELLLRDLLEGQEWLRTRGMTQEPRVLYLPDSFGHSPGTPAILRAAGVPYAAICRIDGMAIPGAEWESCKNFPRPGSTAARLTDERTTDFVWRAPDGSEVLTHWNAYGYGHGDMIASGGVSRWMGLPTAWPSRGEAAVSRRIERCIEQLSRLSRTPYLLLAAGFDFVSPIPRLLDLIDRWNDARYERTGVWMVNAGLDDHLDLVAHHRDGLPTIELDPNPYWMGFYASRPALKRAAGNLGRSLRQADAIAAERILAGHPADERADDGRAEAWWIAVTSNHHDFITGTSPDRVTNKEQWRWLDRAAELARAAAGPVVPDLDTAMAASVATVDTSVAPPTAPATRAAATTVPAETVAKTSEPEPITWHRDGTQVTVITADLHAVFDEARGGALVHLATTNDGVALIDGPALVLIAYAESGGLWRMGHEFAGGRWRAASRSDTVRGEVTARPTDTGAIDVHIETTVAGIDQQLTATFEQRGLEFRCASVVTVPDRHTITVAFPTAAMLDDGPDARPLIMHQSGGVVERPLQRWYDPTFWPLHSFAAAHGIGPDVVVAAATPTAMHTRSDGTIEIVVGRNATKEQAYSFIPLPGQPAKGHERDPQLQRIAIAWPPSGGDDVTGVGRRLWAGIATDPAPCGDLLTVDHPGVEVLAIKPAHRGDGLIVRLRNWGAPTFINLRLAAHLPATIESAYLTDARERDLAPLTVDNPLRVPVDHHFTTVRLVPGPPPNPKPNPTQPGATDPG